MDATSIADNTTVVAGPSSNVNRKDLSHHQYDFLNPDNGLPTAPDRKVPNDFGKTDDVHLADRQFFVTIGPDGLIGALQKLDRQLQTVSNLRINYMSQRMLNICSLAEIIFYQRRHDYFLISYFCIEIETRFLVSYRLDRKGGCSRQIRYY
jgi:hypothetical protein